MLGENKHSDSIGIRRYRYRYRHLYKFFNKVVNTVTEKEIQWQSQQITLILPRVLIRSFKINLNTNDKNNIVHKKNEQNRITRYDPSILNLRRDTVFVYLHLATHVARR